MDILITSSEKDRLGINGSLVETEEKFGVVFQYCDINNSTDLYNLIFRYKVLDQKKFLLTCIEHGLIYKEYGR